MLKLPIMLSWMMPLMAFELFSLLTVGALVTAVAPGFRTAFTEKGFDYARSIGIPILEEELSDMKIPDISGSTSSPIGKIDYSVSNIKGGKLKIGHSSISLSSSSGLDISVSDGSLALTADWKYRMKSWPHVQDHGSVDISASSVSLKFTVELGKDSTGHATVSAGSCKGDVGHMDVHFHGGASWLYNLFSGTIESSLKGTLAKQGCDQGKDAINKQANKALESLPVTVNLDKSALINYALVDTPKFTDTFVETQHKGEFFLRAAPTAEAPLAPRDLPPISKVDNMVYLWLTEYMANTAGYVYFKSNSLHRLITPDMIPKADRDKYALNTTTFKQYLPQLYNKYPNMSMTLLLNNSAPMNISLTGGAVFGSVPGSIGVNVLTGNKTTEDAFVIGIRVHFNATIGVTTNNSKVLLVGKAYYISTDIELLSSNIGTFSVDVLREDVNALALLAVIPFMNQYAQAGIPLPVVEGVQFTNPVVQLGEHYIIVATDIKYNA